MTGSLWAYPRGVMELIGGVGVKLVWKRRPWHRRPICLPPIKKEKAGGPAWGGTKRAFGKTSRDWLVERPGREEEDLERETVDEDEERGSDLSRHKEDNMIGKCDFKHLDWSLTFYSV